MAIINIGILAHVDAGKTTVTERILFETGVIAAAGSVDKGTTQTDTLELERARGITIKSAVVSFQLDDRKVNLIDTPGHADFIAEVERSLRVLDAVVLVISAVEGVQPQTRRLARAIRAAGLPLLIFVNKIDRLGARGEPLLDDIGRKLDLRVVPMSVATGLGSRDAAVTPCDRCSPAWRAAVIDLLAESNEAVIAEFERTGGELSQTYLEAELRAQIAAGQIVPVYTGSGITGAGIAQLLGGIVEWLPPVCPDPGAPLAGTVFKIGRRPSGEKIAYARLFSGELAVRQRITIRRRTPWGEPEAIEERLTGIDRFASGAAIRADRVESGEIVGLHGLRSARIGDEFGSGAGRLRSVAPAFPAPALESVVLPVDLGQLIHLRTALEHLAEQDPLISLRQRNEEGELSVRLYGEVQKEVLTETLEREYGIAVTFGPSQTICIERPTGIGEHVELIGEGDNPYYATVGFRVGPSPVGSGVRYERELGSLPPAFYRAIEETVHETLTQGLHGWEVPDCAITLTHVGFWSPVSTAADFRKLTPYVLIQALRRAGSEVCEPFEEMELEIPEDTFGAVCGALINARATIRTTAADGVTYRLVCEIPTAELRGVEQHLPGLTRGDGGWTSTFLAYVPVTGVPPSRPRTGPNPFNFVHYQAELARA
jgi:ribosomal protection tetracycline resistance protein